MSTRINFSQQVVAIAAAFSFDDMGTLQTMLEGTAIEALEKEDQDALKNVKSIAEKFGIEIDLDFDTPVKVGVAGVKSVDVEGYGKYDVTTSEDLNISSLAKSEGGESSPDGSTEAETNDDSES